MILATVVVITSIRSESVSDVSDDSSGVDFIPYALENTASTVFKKGFIRRD